MCTKSAGVTVSPICCVNKAEESLSKFFSYFTLKITKGKGSLNIL